MFSTYHLHITPNHSATLGVLKRTKFQSNTVFIGQVTDCQVHAIEKAIKPLFADWVTYVTGF